MKYCFFTLCIICIASCAADQPYSLVVSTSLLDNAVEEILPENSGLEVTVLRGKSGEVQHFGEHVIAERGVRHGKLVRMPTEPVGAADANQRRPRHHDHAVKPRVRRAKRTARA